MSLLLIAKYIFDCDDDAGMYGSNAFWLGRQSLRNEHVNRLLYQEECTKARGPVQKIDGVSCKQADVYLDGLQAAYQ